jgi:hypothetical protein
MSTRPLGRSTVIPVNARRSAAPQVESCAAPRKRRRSSLCSFTFADGCQRRIPRRDGHANLCVFHARKEAQAFGGGVSQQGHRLSPLRRLRLRLRSQPRPRTSLRRRSPRPCKAQNRRNPNLSRPTHRSGHAPFPARVHPSHTQIRRLSTATRHKPNLAAIRRGTGLHSRPNQCRCRALARLLPRWSAALHSAIGGCLGSLDEVEISLKDTPR